MNEESDRVADAGVFPLLRHGFTLSCSEPEVLASAAGIESFALPPRRGYLGQPDPPYWFSNDPIWA
jgi:hypothetical protein